MNLRGLTGIILCLSIVVVAACSSTGLKQAETTEPAGSPIIVKGKIAFMESLGGYYILGDVPTGEFFIMNDNPKVLGELYKSGRIVTIEGRIVRGAEYLLIEKIDGQPYRGEQIQK